MKWTRTKTELTSTVDFVKTGSFRFGGKTPSGQNYNTNLDFSSKLEFYNKRPSFKRLNATASVYIYTV